MKCDCGKEKLYFDRKKPLFTDARPGHKCLRHYWKSNRKSINQSTLRIARKVITNESVKKERLKCVIVINCRNAQWANCWRLEDTINLCWCSWIMKGSVGPGSAPQVTNLILMSSFVMWKHRHIHLTESPNPNRPCFWIFFFPEWTLKFFFFFYIKKKTMTHITIIWLVTCNIEPGLDINYGDARPRATHIIT